MPALFSFWLRSGKKVDELSRDVRCISCFDTNGLVPARCARVKVQLSTRSPQQAGKKFEDRFVGFAVDRWRCDGNLRASTMQAGQRRQLGPRAHMQMKQHGRSG